MLTKKEKELTLDIARDWKENDGTWFFKKSAPKHLRHCRDPKPITDQSDYLAEATKEECIEYG